MRPAKNLLITGVSSGLGRAFATAALSAVGKEISGFRIHVTVIEPATFRTDRACR